MMIEDMLADLTAPADKALALIDAQVFDAAMLITEWQQNPSPCGGCRARRAVLPHRNNTTIWGTTTPTGPC